MRRAAAVELIVSVVIRPDTVAGSFQNVAVENIEAESNENIEILGANFLKGIGREVMDKLFSDRLNLDAFDCRKHVPHIDHFEGVVGRLHSRVKAKIKIVEQLFPQLRIRYSPQQRFESTLVQA